MGVLPKDNKGRGPRDSAIEIAIGVHVEVELISELGESERLTFDIVPDADADFSAGFLGVGTPLGRALLGQRAGSIVPYPMGDITQVEILKVAGSSRAPTDDVAADRQAVIQRAVSKSDLADAVRFALTVDQKWGDTDPEGIASNWEGTSGERE
jgi:hypothetical protein